MTTLIDTHAHIYVKKFDSDRSDMLQRAFDNGIGTIIMPAIDVASIHSAIALCQQHPNLFAMAALHPSETKEATPEDFQSVVDLCSDEHVIAVGESGLDYYWDRSFDQQQIEYFRLHINLAIEANLPLILHMRDKQGRDEVHRDMVQILKEERAKSEHPDRLRGIFHCFGGPEWLIQEAMDLQFLLGIGGTVTFKNSGVADLVSKIPLSHIVLETDAPYLAPVPYRGKRNEPAYVRYVAEKVAEVHNLEVSQVIDQTTENARALFQLP